jgi:hypothetical protein
MKYMLVSGKISCRKIIKIKKPLTAKKKNPFVLCIVPPLAGSSISPGSGFI